MLGDLRATARRAPDAGWEVTTLPNRHQPAPTRAARRAWRYIHHHGVPPIAWLIRGLWAIVTAVPKWFFDVDTTKAMTAARHTDPAAYQQLSNSHDKRMDRHRSWWWAYLLGVLLPLAVAVLVVQDRAPGLVPHLPRIAAAAIIVAALIVGYTKPEPIPLADGETPPVTTEVVTSALTKAIAKVAAEVKTDTKAVRYAGPPVRTPSGWRVEPYLPGGVTATDLRKASGAFAAMLGRRDEVIVITTGGSENHAIIDVLDEPLRDRPDKPHPNADARPVNAWDPCPLGTDIHDRPVTAPVIGVHRLIGGRSGSGKSTVLRSWALTAAADPLVDVRIADFGAGADYVPLRPLCSFWRAGSDHDDLDAYDQMLGDLEAECRERGRLMQDHPADFPDGSWTREAAAKYQRPGVVVITDEVQVPMMDKRRAERVTHLIRVARKFGVTLVLATQYPSAQSIPPALSQQCGVRMALRVDTSGASNLILGDGLAGEGFNASDLTVKDRGIGWLVGSEGVPVLMRSFYVPAREVAGIVTQLAVNRPAPDVALPDDDVPSIVGALLAGWPTNADGSPVAGVHLDEAADMLGWTTDTLRERMAEEGIPVNSDVRRKRGERWRTRQGVKLSDLTTASDGMSDDVSGGLSDSVA